jgi:hypothetical protein
MTIIQFGKICWNMISNNGLYRFPMQDLFLQTQVTLKLNAISNSLIT